VFLHRATFARQRPSSTCDLRYSGDVLRFAFFSKAALEDMLKANKRPDVIHCHDWQTDCHLELRFDSELAHLVYAGADHLAMPSLFESCGLVQMIALKYGTVPIVRAVEA
jgi:glycogen synthase